MTKSIANFLKYRIDNCKKFLYRNSIILNDHSRRIQKNRVNLHYWKMDREDSLQNLGDWLSPIIVDHVLKTKNLSLDMPIKKTAHLFAVGSIIDSSYQNATIWGSGLFYIPKKFWYRVRKLDIRSVRGPLTRDILLSFGYDCPEVYGDPALLLPLFYSPEEHSDKNDVVVIPHFADKINNEKYKVINILTDDWQKTVDEIYNSKLVISSSLHGIILAEAYGIPAVLWLPEHAGGGTLKYKDYYYGTGRNEFPVVKDIEDALCVEPKSLKDLSVIQQKLINSFPFDLWE